MPRHFAGEIENFQHHRAFAHDAVKLQILQHFLFEGFYAAALIVEGGEVVQSPFETLFVDGFGQEIGCTTANSFERGIQSVFPVITMTCNPGSRRTRRSRKS